MTPATPPSLATAVVVVFAGVEDDAAVVLAPVQEVSSLAYVSASRPSIASAQTS